ncbi:tyrosine-type recombinase/integrase [Vagococcus fluvialis]|uniref:tyrosine-type recombinase/integrase n=1 Tax=Vagococcus fluvialis TaxID=2738 RepID=UPI0020335C26|nr:tyrosine-type recombinase/integrase [Vagococcus fluvialis]MCM2139860.1 tyrosine-type recombinase/integrase [Vagococcus fluvialis]
MSYNVQPLRTQNEIDDFLFWLRRTNNSERDTFLFLFGINNGLRMSDIVKLKVVDIKYESRPTIVEKKTGKKKILYLDNLSDYIKIYIDGKKDDEWLFPSRQQKGHIKVNTVYKQYQKIAENLDRKDIGTHTLRKTFGYHYYKKTRDIATLMELFNHSSESITKRYIGITTDEIGNSLADFKLGI